MATVLFIDVDGHQDENKQQRARELGYTVYRGDKMCQTGSLYFVDPKGSTPLTLKTAWFSALCMHGLPLNPRPQHFHGVSVYYSNELAEVMIALCENVLKAAAKAGDAHIFVMHKGGDEGKMLAPLGDKITAINLEDLGCPRVDKIALGRPEWVEKHCPHHHPQSKKHKKIAITHCPQLETQIFGRWYVEVCHRGVNPLKKQETKSPQ